MIELSHSVLFHVREPLYCAISKPRKTPSRFEVAYIELVESRSAQRIPSIRLTAYERSFAVAQDD